jgi:hypothetical protein
MAGCLWAISVVLFLLVFIASRGERVGAWVALALVVYAVLAFLFQPSLRYDGDATAGVRMTAAFLVPAVASGVALPCGGRWAAAIGCWCLITGLSAAASFLVWHPSASVGLFVVVWD